LVAALAQEPLWAPWQVEEKEPASAPLSELD
jgi:hypothetical protein